MPISKRISPELKGLVGVLFAIGLIALPGPVAAQGYMDMMGMNLDFGNMVLEQGRMDAMLDDGESEVEEDDSDSDNSSQSEVNGTLNFTSSIKVREAFAAQATASIGDRDYAGKLQKMLASGQWADGVGKLMRSEGFDPYNIADHYSYWALTTWQLANSSGQNIDAQKKQALKNQINRTFASQGALLKATNEEKQYYAEILMLKIFMAGMAAGEAGGDAEKVAAFRQKLKDNAKQDGLDMDKMELTNEGMILK